jgi:hypothetical protein
MGLSMDASRRLAIRGVHEAEDLAGLLIDPVMLVVDALLALDAEVSLVGAGYVGRLHPGQVVHVHVCRHRRLP